MNDEATAFAPACVGNLAAGFDILGHTIHGPGDRVTVRTIAGPDVRIRSIRGVVTDLPLAAEANTAGRALLMLRQALALTHGFEIEIDKGIALGSGMAGSAASAVAALVAANALLAEPLAAQALYPFALAGESLASGSLNGDNVGPMLLGGLVLATSRRLVPIPVPAGLSAAVVRPHLRLDTLRARSVLRDPYPLSDFVTQSEGLALLLAGCYRADFEMIRDGLVDVLVEPRRAALVPGFAEVKQAALDRGALGAGLSGAGPGVFAWFVDAAAAAAALPVMQAAFAAAGHASDAVSSSVAGPAAHLIASR
ncbi:MAG TPA: homoserine kinase [Rhodanobacteraceae bacterium]|nr:homoserine kinase [Rhodanobacteraceae bacterium]